MGPLTRFEIFREGLLTSARLNKEIQEEYSMKHLRIALASLSLLLLASFVFATQHGGSGVKEYDDFHAVLRVLQHEALPANDLKTIRSRAKELVKLGDPIIKLGVPQGTKEDKVEAFKQGLVKFSDALKKYDADAANGSDENLKNSYIAVHDTFEELADNLPRKH